MTEASPARRATPVGWIGAVTLGLLLLTGCGTSGSAPEQTPDTTFSGQYEVNGRSVYLECQGSGSPTVVLIGGLRAAADYWNRAEQPEPTVTSQVAKFTQVCAYDRPGTVQSDNTFSRSEAVDQPSSQASAVADLHGLLAAADITGPVVLAAHSYGGFIARTYASIYSEQVTGLVLIDALSEGFQAALTPEEYEAWKVSQRVAPEDITAYPGIERLNEDAVMVEMRATPPIGSMPITVISADQRYGPGWAELIRTGELPADTPPNLGFAIDTAQRASQEFQASLLPGTLHITETHSGHDIPLDNPSIVVQAIRDIVRSDN